MQIVLFILLLLLPGLAWAAPTYDSSDTVASSGDATETVSITAPSTNPWLIVCIKREGSTTVSDVTYNTVSLTDVVDSVDWGSGRDFSVHYLEAPATGSG